MAYFDKGDYSDCFSSYYTFIRLLGKGSFSTVVKAVDNYTSKVCAVKVIKKHKLSEQVVKEMKQEAELLGSLDHPNVVKFLHMKETRLRVFIGMEYIRGGTLGSLMAKKRLREPRIASAFRGIFSAVQYLHEHGIVHRDLKPENILVADPRDLTTVKVADFGLSKQLDIVTKTDERCGTALFMAPEVAGKRHYSKEVDIWSCGIILYMMITAKHPFYKPKMKGYFEKLQNPEWVFPSPFTELSQNLFLNLVKIDPLERYSAKQALEHPWLSENTEIPLTFIEKLRVYEEEVKLRYFLYTFVFATIVRPPAVKVIVRSPKMRQQRTPFKRPSSTSPKKTSSRTATVSRTFRIKPLR